jgi:protein-serine/threonine kinase
LSDFGLATDLHWLVLASHIGDFAYNRDRAHDGAYYDQQRRALLRKHGIDLEDTLTGTSRRSELPTALKDEKASILTWRESNRKKLAYSVVGTNNYMVFV